MNTRIWMLTLGLLLGGVAGPAAAGFEDPLDTPAQPSALAARGLFNGLAQAGRRIVAVGQRGHILYSDDQGQHWTQAQVPLSSDLTAVHFPTARDGWAVGQDGVVLVSHDAGASWSRQLDGRAIGPLLVRYYAGQAPAGLSAETLQRLREDAQRFADGGADKPLLDVWFADAQNGYAIGAFNLLLATRDGGRSWEPALHRADNPRALHLYALRPVGGELYVVGEQGLVMKLDRAGGQFRALALPYRGTLFGVTGDGQGVIVYGLRGTALRSVDGGAQWTLLPAPQPVSLTASTKGAGLVLASQTGQLLAVAADGRLQALPLAQRVPASALLQLDDHHYLVAGPRGLHRIATGSSAEAQP